MILKEGITNYDLEREVFWSLIGINQRYNTKVYEKSYLEEKACLGSNTTETQIVKDYEKLKQFLHSNVFNNYYTTVVKNYMKDLETYTKEDKVAA